MSRFGPTHDDFYAQTRSAESQYVVGDSVNIVGGPYEGQVGAALTVKSDEQGVRYMIELCDGTDVWVAAEDLRLFEGAG